LFFLTQRSGFSLAEVDPCYRNPSAFIVMGFDVLAVSKWAVWFLGKRDTLGIPKTLNLHSIPSVRFGGP
jgi:hypothetical protein